MQIIYNRGEEVHAVAVCICEGYAGIPCVHILTKSNMYAACLYIPDGWFPLTAMRHSEPLLCRVRVVCVSAGYKGGKGVSVLWLGR